MTPSGTIDYETLAQDAMRGVIRKILKATEQSGLPGEHHFYISFDTTAPGASLSKRLRERYPEEMTIVLQHRFWDLLVSEDQFEVKLTFDSIPERLVVPFKAIKVFFDPSVRYALQFEAPELNDETDAAGTPGKGIVEPKPSPAQSDRPVKRSLTPVASKPVAKLPRKAAGPTAATTGNGKSTPDASEAARSGTTAEAEAPAKDAALAATGSDASVRSVDQQSKADEAAPDKPREETAATDTGSEPPDADEKTDGGAVVVSLDAFRKK